MSAHDSITHVVAAMNRAVLGQEAVVERLVLALLCNGNVLVEGLPGTAKTRSIKTLARVLDATLSRVQFTPDLLPSDVTGTEMLHTAEDGRQRLEFQAGPIFANLVLADEINRAPAKVQSALLEAMEERQVTVAGKTHRLPELFLVLATQNPIEQEGTYPLPEAQMDRFLMKVLIEYPSEETEARILSLVRDEDRAVAGAESARVPQEIVLAARREVLEVHVADSVVRYIVALVGATRAPGRYDERLARWIEIGSSPRATLSLDRASRARAWLRGRDHVTPDDVRAIAKDVLRHRLVLGYEASAEGLTSDAVLDALLEVVAVSLTMDADSSSGAYASLASLARLEPLAAGFSLLPRQPVHSLLSGRHASRLRGRGLDFEELRNYRPGDDVRTIDWRATQRSGRPQVRVFTEERDRPVLVVVDQRRAMFFGSRRSTKSVAAAEVAALGAWRALRQGDRVGGIVFDDERTTELRPHRSRRRLLRLFDAIVEHNHALRADTGPASRPERLNEVLRQARRLAAHDHLVLLVTDFDGADEETREHVARLAYRNDVLAAFVHDPLETRLPAAGPLLFGAREEQLELDTSDRRLRERFGADFAQRAERLRDDLSGRAVPVIPIDAAEPVPEQVRRHVGRALAARRRRR